MDGTLIVSKFEQIFHDGGMSISIEQKFQLLKGTKISFYTVAGSSCSIRRMRTLVPATPVIDPFTERVYR